MQAAIRFFYALFLTLSIFSCKKYTVPETEQPEEPGILAELNVPEDFTWTTTKELQPEIVFNGDLASKFLAVEILDENFNRIHKYFKSTTENSIVLDRPINNTIDSAYIFCVKENIFQAFATSSNKINVSPGNNSGIVRQRFNDRHAQRNGLKSNCSNDNCDRTSNSSRGRIEVGADENLCITSDFTGNITFSNGGKLTICANVNTNNLNINGNKTVEIVISEQGRLSCKNFNVNDKAVVKNYGIVEISNNLNNNSTLVNYGIWNNAGGLNLNNKGSIENLEDGTMVFSGHANVNNNLINAGSLSFAGNFNLNNGANLENYCSMTVNGDFQGNGGDITNAGYVKVTGRTTINNNCDLSLADRSIWHSRDLTCNGGSFDMGGNAVGVFTVKNQTTLNNGMEIRNGFLDICDQNGIENNRLRESAAALLKECETTVSTDECIAEGIVSEQDPDEDDDNDGVDNGDDDDDDNQEVAGTFNYPSNGYAFRAYEDLWPSRGDYDFNDMVLKYKVTFGSNAQNQITEATVDIEVKAIGAAIPNGIGLQFLSKNGNNYSRYSENIYQSTSDNIIVDPADASTLVLTNNIFEELPVIYKNDGEGPDGTPYQFTAEIQFAPGSNISASSVVPDLFIFRTEERGREVHLPGIPPTAAVDESLFNTQEDASAEGDTYETAQNYPWGMEVHGVETFLHPRSKVSITEAYPNFASWVNNNGEVEQDWYIRPDVSLCY